MYIHSLWMDDQVFAMTVTHNGHKRRMQFDQHVPEIYDALQRLKILFMRSCEMREGKYNPITIVGLRLYENKTGLHARISAQRALQRGALVLHSGRILLHLIRRNGMGWISPFAATALAVYDAAQAWFDQELDHDTIAAYQPMLNIEAEFLKRWQ